MVPDATADLLRRTREGSNEAREALFGRLAGKLLPLIRIRMGRELRSVVESQDLLQDCLMKALLGVDGFRAAHGGSLAAWLARIAENEIRDHIEYRHRRRRDARNDVPLENRADELATQARSALSRVLLDENTQRLERALQSLGNDHREVVMLRRLEERSWADVAATMNKSPDACRMLFARAMVALTVAMGAPSS